MRKGLKYCKYLVAGILVLGVQVVHGSFTGNSDGSKDKFSLKNIGSLKKTYSLSSLHINTFRYKCSDDLVQQNTDGQVQVTSMVRLERGNTTYVYPYKYTVKVPKFVTPKAPSSH
jgi:hypothetical protein